MLSLSLSVCQSLGHEATKCGSVLGQELLCKVTIGWISAAGAGLPSQVHHMQERTSRAALARGGAVHFAKLHGRLQALETRQDPQVSLTV